MTLTFADTHNMIAHLTKSDASEGFEQILDFLNASVINYVLTVNLTIYVSCIKQFWSSVLVKKVNDVIRLQALIDRKKVIITKDIVRQALHLDDAESIDCLPNEGIFAELVRMSYEKPYTKLTFYMAFFSAQWKFLIHKILQCMSAKRTAWNKFSSSMALAIIYLATVGDLTSHTTKYTSLALTQKVFANMRRVGKGFSGVNTPLLEGMLVQQQAANDVDDVVAENVPADDVADVVADDVIADVVAYVGAEPTPPSPTPTTTTPPPQELPSTSQDIREEEEVESFRIEKIKEGGIIAKIDADMDVTLEEVDAAKDAKDDEPEPAELKEVIEVVTTAKLMTEVVIVTAPITAATITVAHSAFEEPKPLKKQAQIEQDEAYARKLEAKLNRNINWDDVIEQVKRKEKEDNDVLRYQALKRKPQTEAQTRKNMMVYLKNMAGFKMDFFKGMSYDDIIPIFEKYFNSNVAFLEKNEKELEEEASRSLKRKTKSSEQQAIKKQKLDEEVEELKKHLQIVPNDEDDVYTEVTPLALKVPVVDYEIHTKHNKPYYKIIRVDGTHQIFLSFISLLRNFDKEDLEMLWQIVQERFASSKLNNFSDDFLLATLKPIFEKPDVEAQVWKNQRGI
nr:hypothetical protein [Tanacetum cinerariifolium]